MKDRKLKKFVLIMISALTVIYVIAVCLDIIPGWNACVLNLKENCGIPGFDLRNKAEAMLGVYGTVWTISIGVIVFVVQRGYGPTMGLSMADILELMLESSFLSMFVMGYLMMKFPLYVVAFWYHWKFTLVWGMAESFLSLAAIIRCFMFLPDINTVSLLLQKNTKKNMRSKKGLPELHKWKLVKCVKDLNYESSEECSALIDQLTVFLKEIRMPNQIPEREMLSHVTEQMHILELVLENICFTSAGKERINYIVKQCVENLSEKSCNGPIIPSRGSVRRERNLQKFLLLEGLMNISEDAGCEKLIEMVLAMSESRDAAEILAYLMYYLIILLKVRRENVWSRMLLRELWRYSRKPDLITETDTLLHTVLPNAPGCRMICLEYFRHGLKGMANIGLNNFTQIAYESMALETEIHLEGSR